MARTHARIHNRIWSDPDWRTLTADGQWLYLALLTSPKLTLAGSLDIKARSWAQLAADMTTERIHNALEDLAERRFIVVDDDTEELIIRSFVANDGLCKTPNVAKGMWVAWSAIESDTLRRRVVEGLPAEAFTAAVGPLAEPLPEGIPEPLAEPLAEPVFTTRNKGSRKGGFQTLTTPTPTPTPTNPPSEGLGGEPPVDNSTPANQPAATAHTTSGTRTGDTPDPTGDTPDPRSATQRQQRTNPRAQGTNPRAQGTSPRQQRTNPRATTTPLTAATQPTSGGATTTPDGTRFLPGTGLVPEQ